MKQLIEILKNFNIRCFSILINEWFIDFLYSFSTKSMDFKVSRSFHNFYWIQHIYQLYFDKPLIWCQLNQLIQDFWVFNNIILIVYCPIDSLNTKLDWELCLQDFKLSNKGIKFITLFIVIPHEQAGSTKSWLINSIVEN